MVDLEWFPNMVLIDKPDKSFSLLPNLGLVGTSEWAKSADLEGFLEKFPS